MTEMRIIVTDGWFNEITITCYAISLNGNATYSTVKSIKSVSNSVQFNYLFTKSLLTV